MTVFSCPLVSSLFRYCRFSSSPTCLFSLDHWLFYSSLRVSFYLYLFMTVLPQPWSLFNLCLCMTVLLTRQSLNNSLSVTILRVFLQSSSLFIWLRPRNPSPPPHPFRRIWAHIRHFLVIPGFTSACLHVSQRTNIYLACGGKL
jgi:hypothetical protein